MTYEQWVREKATELGTDGCTLVTELFHWCCLEHDIAYRTGLDPRALYRGQEIPITRAEATNRFRDCMRKRAKTPLGHVVAWGRWVGLRVKEIIVG